MTEINFSLALNKPHKANHLDWKLLDGEKVKKLSERFFTKDSKGKITNQELHPDEFKFEGINFAKIEQEQEKIVKSITSSCDYIDFDPDWRFIIGLGGASVYDTGITLHHTYGIPYIPATSIKGTVRSWRILEPEFKKTGEDSEGLAIENEEFCRIFGCPKNIDLTKKGFRDYNSALKHKGEDAEFEGNIIFFDAFPLTVPKLKLDIMNPHYQPYYSDNDGKTPPADYFSPNPIMFLTVEKTVFRMYFGVKKEVNKNLLDVVKKWLLDALEQRGIGAKSAVGYGYKKSTTQNTKVEGPKIIISVKETINSANLNEGMVIEVEVADVNVKYNLIRAKLPWNKSQFVKIDDAPLNIKVGEMVKVSCKLKKGKLDSFKFISKP